MMQWQWREAMGFNTLLFLVIVSSFFSTTSIYAFSLLRSNGSCGFRSFFTDLSGGDCCRQPTRTSRAARQLFVSANEKDREEDNDDEVLLNNDIDSFLRGDYDRPFAKDAPAPHPDLSPRATVEKALSSLRDLNKPEQAHGAAVLQRFCAPLSRAERWGGGSAPGVDPWKEVMRGALTPTMLARRIRASVFSVLLDWTKLDVTDGYSIQKELIGVPSLSFVNAALFFGDGVEPCIVQFTLRKVGGAWLIDTARVSKKELFVKSDTNSTTS